MEIVSCSPTWGVALAAETGAGLGVVVVVVGAAGGPVLARSGGALWEELAGASVESGSRSGRTWVSGTACTGGPTPLTWRGGGGGGPFFPGAGGAWGSAAGGGSGWAGAGGFGSSREG